MKTTIGKKSLWQCIRENPSLYIGAALLILLLVMAIFPGLFTKQSPTDICAEIKLQKPSQEHIFGTDVYQEFHIAHDIDDKETHGGQPGDPIKVAELFIRLAEEKKPPCSLFLDYPVEELIDKIMSERWSQWKEWAPVAASVEY